MSLKTASVLAFERKLNPSDALMYAGNWADRANAANWPSIAISEKAVRGTISNRLKSSKAPDDAKLDAEVQKPNLQTVDAAALPPDADTLLVNFTLRVIGGVGHPSACNSQAYQQALHTTVSSYVDTHGFDELAHRYACNLANGRFLWRNRLGAEAVEVQVRIGENALLVFDAYARPQDDFGPNSALEPVADAISTGLSGDQYTLLHVNAFAKIGPGQEVYPSQELVQDKVKSKHLYQVDGTAALHSQKIGNALRTIDTWHPEEAGHTGAIAAEPYGSVTSRGIACRTPKSNSDFYTLFDKWVCKGTAPDTEQQHYVMAILVRGGVFGEVNS